MSTFVITKVQYDATHCYIQKVKGFIENLYSAEDMEFDRKTIVDLMAAGFIYRVHQVDNDGKEIEGPIVRIVRVNEGDFLQTSPIGVERDNLGELPEY